MSWGIKNIASLGTWNKKPISLDDGWASRFIGSLKWNFLTLEKWNETTLKWDSSATDKWNIKNVNINPAQDYEWDESSQVWSSFNLNWNDATSGINAAWVLNSINTPTWTRKSIVD